MDLEEYFARNPVAVSEGRCSSMVRGMSWVAASGKAQEGKTKLG